jgi:pimeloyl-ACP methyl ester carboxylesterase
MLLPMLTSFAGAQLFGESYGTGVPAVLALHGWRRDHRDFAGVLSRPEPAVDSISIDLPGFGATPAPPEVWGSQQYARALVPVLDEMQSRVVVIGHSFGGRVAVHLAQMAPERVAGLVLTASPLFRAFDARRRSPLSFRAVKRLAGLGLLSEQRLEQSRQRYGSADYKAASGIIRDILVKLLAEDYREVLSKIECPVELVWGDDDRDVPLAVAEKVQGALRSHAHLVVCAGAGHLTPLTVPAELRSAIERLTP